ncbi:hypothetical protein [Gluconobacter thailandicus]|nr:hypothetical protein [Gluconobacter thailandicus]
MRLSGHGASTARTTMRQTFRQFRLNSTHHALANIAGQIPDDTEGGS